MPPILLPTLFQGGLSLIQMIKGLTMQANRPTYNIPQEVNDKLAQQQVNLNARSAGAGRAEANIFSNQATTLQNAQQAGGGASNQLLAGALAQAQSNRGLENLSASEREDYQRRLGNLGQAQSEMAGYRDRAFDYNKAQPYENAAATKSALIQGGLTNAFGALQSFNPIEFGQNQQQSTSSQYFPQRSGLMPSQQDYYNSQGTRNQFMYPNYYSGQMNRPGLMG